MILVINPQLPIQRRSLLVNAMVSSVKEAACSGIPSLFMPMFAEQMRNAWLAKSKVSEFRGFSWRFTSARNFRALLKY